MSEKKYNLLVCALDQIADGAPDPLSVYHPKKDNLDTQAHKRARTFIHLFLKVRFGILDFNQAESQITDGTNDGGLDAYHIDEEEKKIYLIQAKFSSNPKNFNNKSVDPYEFFKMELDKIITGELVGENEERYNGKIIDFQKKIKNIPNINKYQYILIYLGNVSNKLIPNQLRQVTGNVCDDIEIINGESFYKDVLMPYLRHDFFTKKDFVLKIRVHEDQSNRINYIVNLETRIEAKIDLVFVPIKEIAEMMSKYRNSLLRYNPRCYIGIQRSGVNNAIRESVININQNEFSLLNNGITIICTNFSYSDRNAEPKVATLSITNPQIVNGGQTAFTLAHLLENSNGEDHFKDKEVLVKFIALPDNKNRAEVIEKISKATNSQTSVKMADRKSNDTELVQLQDYLFDTHDLLLERKKGEFYDSVQKGLVKKDSITSVDLLMRLLLVYKGEIARARGNGLETIFKNYSLENVNHEALYLLVKIYRKIEQEENRAKKIPDRERYKVDKWGNGLRYGKYAITFFVRELITNKTNQIDQELEEKLDIAREKWNDFETTVSNNPENESYNVDGFDFDNYYKGSTINKNLVEYLKLITVD